MGLFVTVITLRGWNQGSLHHLPTPLNTPGEGKQQEWADGWVDAVWVCKITAVRMCVFLFSCIDVRACLFYCKCVCARTGLVPMCPPTQAALRFWLEAFLFYL